MSTAQGDAREFSPGEWANMWRRGCAEARRWSLFEAATMILGFVVFWPIGLAVLVYKLWAQKHGGDHLQTFASARWNEAHGVWSRAQAARNNTGSYSASGSRAFDDWKSAELDRLEAERRKLEEAAREFSEFLNNVRRAKDREEFDRFMNDRRNRSPA